MFCPQCGQENDGQSKFCTACGCRLQQNISLKNAAGSAVNYSSSVEYAGFWRRAGAYLIDSGVLFLGMLIVMVIVRIFYETLAINDEQAYNNLANILAILVGWLYYAFMESSPKQATLGKMAIGMIVTDLDGNRISFAKASGRFFGKIVSGIILLMGYVMAGITDKKQALHDMMSGCLVVMKNSSTTVSSGIGYEQMNRVIGQGQIKDEISNINKQCLALFLFDSDIISDKESAAYGSFAEGKILNALCKAVQQEGGWGGIPPIRGCHGDLFPSSPFSGRRPFESLGNLIRLHNSGADEAYLDSNLVAALRNGPPPEYIPYAVALEPLQKAQADAADKELRALEVTGYKGLVTFSESPGLAFIDRELLLPADLYIQSGKCKGWLAGGDIIRQAQLEMVN